MKEIYIFGAGASNASTNDVKGTPLGKELGWKYFHDCTALPKVANGKPNSDDKIALLEQFSKVTEKYYPELKEEQSKYVCSVKGSIFECFSLFLSIETNKKYSFDELLYSLA